MKSPGYSHSQINIPKKNIDDLKNFIRFNGNIADISPPSEKTNRIYQGKIDYFYEMDYNFDEISNNKYDTILCLEVLEHLQNPLLFMQNVKKMMYEGTSLYLSTPGRKKIMWPDFHFFEMPKKHLEKWILEPLGLKIRRYKYLPARHVKFEQFIGIRPLIRLLFFKRGTNIYEIGLK